MDDEAKAIIEAIRSAFAGVPRGRITLHEAEVMDLYGTDAQRQQARLLDTDESWDEVLDRDVAECTTALSYVDPEGWRYYIPAYMVWSLRYFREPRGMASDATIYTFDPHNDYAGLRERQRSRFQLLDHAQSRAVCRFLRYMAAHDDHADARMANEALSGYWDQFGEGADGRG